MTLALVRRKKTVIQRTTLDAMHLTLATHTLAVGGGIVQAVADVANGIKVTLNNPAGAAQLPHTGAACWMRPTILGQDGLAIFPWYPAFDRIEALVMEREAPSINPGLIRWGMLVANYSDPSNALCTEGYGWYVEYPSTDVRQVGIVRCSAAGTWVGLSGTGNVSTCGVSGTCGGGGQQVVRNVTAVATDGTGLNMAPQANNDAIGPAADAVQNMTQQRTAGVAVTWYTGFWAGWAAAGGTTGCFATFDPMYWIQKRPGAG